MILKFPKEYGVLITIGITTCSLIVGLGLFMWTTTSSQYTAMRADVGDLRTDTRGMRTEIAGLRTDLRTDVKGVRAEISGLRNDLRTDVGAMRMEIVGLRNDLRINVQDMRDSIQQLVKNQIIWQGNVTKQLSQAGTFGTVRLIHPDDQDGPFGKALKALQGNDKPATVVIIPMKTIEPKSPLKTPAGG